MMRKHMIDSDRVVPLMVGRKLDPLTGWRAPAPSSRSSTSAPRCESPMADPAGQAHNTARSTD
jgi:hypothetical protein